LDLKKAFDVCSHDVLVKKLDNLGVRGATLDWFKSYLSNRKHVVDISESTSDPIKLDALSIIQGSTLGPILFNIYINDLPNATKLFTALFADDTAAPNRGKALGPLIASTNQELVKLGQWFRANKMAVNINKTSYIIFYTKGKKIYMQNSNIVFNNNDPEALQLQEHISILERIHSNHTNNASKTYKLLGLYLDENLAFDSNTNMLLSKLAKAIHVLNKVKHILPQKALLNLYYALFHSHLTYCPTIVIVSMASLSNIAKIEKMQKKAVRTIALTTYNAHTAPLFSKFKIMRYTDIIRQSQLHIMHAVYCTMSMHLKH